MNLHLENLEDLGDYYEEIVNREKAASERLVKELSEKAVLETIKSQLELQIAQLKVFLFQEFFHVLGKNRRTRIKREFLATKSRRDE